MCKWQKEIKMSLCTGDIVGMLKIIRESTVN